MVFEEMVPGGELPALEFVCEEEVQGRYLTALQEENPWYHKESPWGGPITHHALLDDALMMGKGCWEPPAPWFIKYTQGNRCYSKEALKLNMIYSTKH